MRKTLEMRQEELEGLKSATRLKQKLQESWPHIDAVTILVTGQHEVDDADRIELSLSIHVHSTSPFPNLLQGSLFNARTGTRLTFAQIGTSVPTGSCATFLSAQYMGIDPPSIPP